MCACIRLHTRVYARRLARGGAAARAREEERGARSSLSRPEEAKAKAKRSFLLRVAISHGSSSRALGLAATVTSE